MTIAEEYSIEIIKLILSMTFTGSIISIFLFILKPIIRDKLPKSFQYYIWFSVVIAFLLPLSKIIVIPVSNNSIMSMKSMYDISQWISDTASETPINLVVTPQGDRKITNFPNIAVFLFTFWQLGILLVLGFHIICYASYVQKLGKHNIGADRQEIELLNNLLERKNSLQLYKNSIVEIPILIGFFRPKVLLPNKKY